MIGGAEHRTFKRQGDHDEGAILHGPRDIRLEERDAPKIVHPTDAIIRIASTCLCGSDLWPYRGINRITWGFALVSWSSNKRATLR